MITSLQVKVLLHRIMKAFLVINCLAILLVQVVHGFAPLSVTGSKTKTSATSTELQVWAEPYYGGYHGYGRRRYSAYYRPTRDDGVDGAGRLDMVRLCWVQSVIKDCHFFVLTLINLFVGG